jgi:methionyl-tRNA formyltransferase
LIYGNTFLTAEVCQALVAYGEQGTWGTASRYILIGYVPNRNAPTVPGKMPILEASDQALVTGAYDIGLSIQYDQMIVDSPRPVYNVHTGLLPMWGGCDILYHTLREKATEQGLTFHRITDRFDYGPILCKMSYPVLPGDTMLDLYVRLAAITPGFVIAALEMLGAMGHDWVEESPSYRPRLFHRGEIAPEDREVYNETPDLLREFTERKNA